jgi:hypothetical protein
MSHLARDHLFLCSVRSDRAPALAAPLPYAGVGMSARKNPSGLVFSPGTNRRLVPRAPECGRQRRYRQLRRRCHPWRPKPPTTPYRRHLARQPNVPDTFRVPPAVGPACRAGFSAVCALPARLDHRQTHFFEFAKASEEPKKLRRPSPIPAACHAANEGSQGSPTLSESSIM